MKLLLFILPCALAVYYEQPHAYPPVVPYVEHQEPVIDHRGPTVSPAAFCKQCIEERNGVGYYEDPKDCRNYLQCDIDSDGSVFAHVKTCAEGTLFDRNIAACVPCGEATCDGSYAPSPLCPPTTPPPPTTPAGPTVLPPFAGHCYGPDNWIYHAVSGDPHIFYREQTLGEETSIEKVSCGQWEFSVSTCMCIVPDQQAIGYWPFDEHTDTVVDNFWTDAEGIELGPGQVGQSAYFNGSTHIEVPRFNNYEWGAGMTISAWFNVQGDSRRQGLLNNGDCQAVPSIQLWVEGGHLGGHVLVDSNGTLVTVTIDAYADQGWNWVAITYDGLRVVVSLNGNVIVDEIAVGKIPATLAPLFMGRDLECEAKGQGNTNLVGNLDEVQIYDWALNAEQLARVGSGEGNIRMARRD